MSNDDKPSFADTLEGQLLAQSVASGKFLTDSCAELGLAPSTIFRRLREDAKFAALMDDARDTGFDIMASRVPKIIRGEEGYSSGDVKRDRLIAEYDMKLLAKWHPARYGDKIQIEQKTANIDIPVGNDPVAAQQAYEKLMKGS